ncbi:MAG: septal ring lytic transglycosylase RlpA family protein [Frateuria sp.]|nr:septal ring lytic transglycosylase RlpA family protein [Frateuria sp.]
MNRRAGGLVLLALLLAGCGSARPRPSHGGSMAGSGAEERRGGFVDDISRPQGSRYRDGSDSVPPPIDVSRIPEPVPKVEPRSLYGNKSPYTVLGQTYRVLPSARGYDERGIASFYGAQFHGYKTSSLEDYDMYAFSAAHKTLPLPSYARVTNLANGKSVIVRINDRGPFHENRLIDLSYAAAVKIGVWPKGTGLVEVRAIDPAHPEDSAVPAAELDAQAAVPQGGARPAIYLQVGAFADLANADRVAQQLRSARLAPVQVIDAQINGRSVRRVRIGPLDDVERADQVTAQIERLGLPRPQVAVD